MLSTILTLVSQCEGAENTVNNWAQQSFKANSELRYQNDNEVIYYVLPKKITIKHVQNTMPFLKAAHIDV